MNLENFIKNTGERDCYFLPNEGNAGDGLIHAGFYQMAERIGLRLTHLQYPSEQKGKFLFIMGAGAFCKASWHKVEAVNYLSSRFEHVCLLPSTFDTKLKPVAEMLRNLPANVTIFCRERISFDAVSKLVSKPERVLLDHDLAFEIDGAKWTNPGAGALNAFRTDGESLLGRVPYRNFDISDMGREINPFLVVDIVANFETIYTDRLHVSIAGALLGKKVYLFEGNYHKIRGIYEYSLKERFPNVVLCSTDELKRYLAASHKAGFKVHIYRMLIGLPFGQKIVNFVRKILRRQVQMVPVIS